MADVPGGHISQLEAQVKRFWKLETEAERARNNEDIALSIDDKRVLNLWNTDIRVVGGHYQLPIPFRKERQNLPNNRVMTERRLMSLRRRFLKDSKLHARYMEEMQLMLEKGYAEFIPPTEVNSNPDYT